MIHPTRTNLLFLKEKSHSVGKSMSILKARRKALIKEFLNTTVPFIKSREEIRKLYGKAVKELVFSLGYEGKTNIDSISVLTERDFNVNIIERIIWGVKFRDILADESPVRNLEDRKYNYFLTTAHLEECIYLFEKLVESLIRIAAFENKIKIISDEIGKTTRRIRILEEKILPELKQEIRTISQHINDREREARYSLKKFKEIVYEVR